MGQPLVELVDIRKRYGTGEAAFEALRGVSFSIDEGEFVAIMGASGSGKSTAMNIIGALDSPTAGAYLFSGMHVEPVARPACAPAAQVPRLRLSGLQSSRQNDGA